MRRGLRTATVTALILLLNLISPACPGSNGGETQVAVDLISPPPGLALPVDQAVAIRYRLVGAHAILVLRADDLVIAETRVDADQEIDVPWAPATEGLHCLSVRAFDAEGTSLASAERSVTGLPRGASVQLSPMTWDRSSDQDTGHNPVCL